MNVVRLRTVIRRPSLMLLVAAALACSACGSSGPPSKASFIASADSICKAGNHALQPLKQVTSTTSDAVAVRILRSASGTFSGAANRLGALTAPPSLAAPWHAYVSDIKQEVTDVSGLANAIGARNAVTFRRDLLQVGELAQQAKAAIAGKGFSHCGQGR